jgi:hypothetical protein
MRDGHTSLTIVAAFVVVVGGVEVALQGHDRDEPLAITQLTLEASRELDRAWTEDTYRARLTHTGPAGSVDYARVTARIGYPFGLPAPGLVQVVDGDLAFGAVRAGESVESVDTITIRRLRHQPLKPNQLRWSIDGRPDLVPSDAWAGRWRFTMTTKDADSGQIVSMSEVTDEVGPDEPFGLSLLPPLARCTWRGTDDSLQATCRAVTRIGGCHVDASAALTLERDGDALSGHAQWSASNAGDCGNAGGSGAEAMEIAAVRESADVETGALAPGWLPTFVMDPRLSFLIAGTGAILPHAPGSDGDCRDQRWRLSRRGKPTRGRHRTLASVHTR